MGSNDGFGPDTDTIRAWLEKRSDYVDDDFQARHRGEQVVPEHPSPATPDPTVDPMPAPTPRRHGAGPDGREAGRSVLAALDQTSGEDAADPAPESPAEEWSPAPQAVRTPVTDVEFRPHATARRVLSAVLVGCVVVTAAAASLAATDPTTATIGLAGTSALLTMVVWAIRAGAVPVQVAIRSGRLVLRRGPETREVDLASPYVPVAVLGTPGQRGWKVLVEQVDAPVLTITPALVDPVRFTEVLHRIRPELRHSPTAGIRAR